MTFDYLGRRWNLRTFLRRSGITRGARTSIGALICSCIVVAASWAIEANRLRESLQFERSLADRYEAQTRTLAQANVYSNKVQNLVRLDRRIRSIVGSGTSTARRLAAIAGDLPANVWLTSVVPDSLGLAVEGRAPNLAALGLALRQISRDRSIGDPALMSAQVEDGAAPDLAVRFTMHVTDGSVSSTNAFP
ncbi:MAG TPA: PilN domain-containing protein [Candidatus Rubrimentiphilum sp.]|nr:PilN domain-containing protein [Candidatus Rubrimentiphilum sp.]